MSMQHELLSWLAEWYTLQCDEDWEHSYGVKIDTLDNPGWSLVVDLSDTYLDGRNYLTLDIQRGENDWLKCALEGKKFVAHCGPRNLPEVIQAFRHWAETKV